MYFVDKQDRLTAALLQREFSLLNRVTDFFDARQHRRDGDELGVEGMCHQARERGLAHTGRTPQDHRVRLARLECEPQRLARAEQMRLAHHGVERMRPQPLRERRRRLGLFEKIVHGKTNIAKRARLLCQRVSFGDDVSAFRRNKLESVGRKLGITLD